MCPYATVSGTITRWTGLIMNSGLHGEITTASFGGGGKTPNSYRIFRMKRKLKNYDKFEENGFV